MRTLKELYEVLLASGQIETDNSICIAIGNLQKKGVIYMHEYHELSEHLKSNKPLEAKKFMFITYKRGKHLEFIKHKSFIGQSFWWKCNVAGLNQRKLFINHLISKLL